MRDRLYSVLRRPILTEKTSHFLKSACYTFEVDGRCGKSEIKEAVEGIFSVKVKTCRVVSIKKRRKSAVVDKGRRRVTGFTAGKKKAYVTLASGHKLSEFEGV